MKIGIDVSQVAYSNTGVANYLLNLVKEMVKNQDNEFVLFYSSLRNEVPESLKLLAKSPHVTIKTVKIPQTALRVLWNKLHVLPIEWFIGQIDLFITSDWTEPPANKAKKATIIYDLIVYKFPNETHEDIVNEQKRKLTWVKKESDIIFCISEATKKDVNSVLGIDLKKLHVIYPGFT